MGDLPKTRFGRYELLERLDVGSFTLTYRATDTKALDAHSTVAVQRLFGECTRDSMFLDWYFEVIRRNAGFRHENVVRILDFGAVDGEPFTAREWVDGKTLGDVQRKARKRGMKWLPPPVAVSVAIDVCRGLHHAHQGEAAGLFHQELSPHKVMVGFGGEVKVFGFGLTRWKLPPEAGVLMGKITHFSPELMKGVYLDARSDVFVMGIVLYQLLCGALPFDADHDVARMEQALKEQYTPAGQRNPSLDDDLLHIVQRTLRRHPEDRYPSAEALGQALTEWQQTHAPAFRPELRGDWMNWLYHDELVKQGRELSLSFQFLVQLESLLKHAER